MRSVRFPVPAEVAYDFTIAPSNRALWQASLRRVDDVEGPDAVPGQTWTDVTVPGLRPRMRLEAAERPRLWTESGRWRAVTAELSVAFTPDDDGGGCTASVAFELSGHGPNRVLAALAARLAPRVIAQDLRRAAVLLAADPTLGASGQLR